MRGAFILFKKSERSGSDVRKERREKHRGDEALCLHFAAFIFMFSDRTRHKKTGPVVKGGRWKDMV